MSAKASLICILALMSGNTVIEDELRRKNNQLSEYRNGCQSDYTFHYTLFGLILQNISFLM